jgi:hypothetical protein
MGEYGFEKTIHAFKHYENTSSCPNIFVAFATYSENNPLQSILQTEMNFATMVFLIDSDTVLSASAQLSTLSMSFISRSNSFKQSVQSLSRSMKKHFLGLQE